MHTYRLNMIEGGTKEYWIVGFNSGEVWTTIKVFLEEKHAAAYVSYLNGGNRQLFEGSL
jgi:hypothetical protein